MGAWASYVYDNTRRLARAKGLREAMVLSFAKEGYEKANQMWLKVN